MRSGETAVVRYVWRRKLCGAAPMTVVDDGEDRTILWLPRGTGVVYPQPTKMPDWVANGFGTVAVTWKDTDVLHLVPAGRAHSTYAMWWADTGAFLCWYVNLQAPLARTAIGWDTFDHELDVVVQPDGRWEWKDEADLETRVAHGLVSRAEADAIRREGERVIDDVEAGRPPFSEPWPDWRPDPGWAPPSFPLGWDDLS